MAGFSSSKGDAPITGINVTPLVDIVLVLLIIFMVTAKLVVSRAVPMDLPQAATGDEVQQVFAVSLTKDGAIHVDDTRVQSMVELHDLARSALAENAEVRAVIRADGEVPHRQVMEALDALRQGGIARVAFAVSQGEDIEAQRARDTGGVTP